MSDGSPVKQAVGEVAESVIKPVVDEVGKAIEEGVQSIISTPKAQDPAAQQRKLQEEQKKKEWALKVVEFNKNLVQAQQKVHQDNLQKEQARHQEENQVKQVKQYEAVEKKKENIALKQAKTRTEIKGGVGG